MLTEKRVKAAFADYHSRRLSPEARAEIDAFLEKSAECRAFYHKMSAVLDGGSKDFLPRLQPNPNLAALIRREGQQQKQTVMRRLGIWQLATMSLVVMLGVVGGIQMGRSLATQDQSSATVTTDLASAYYQALVQEEDPAVNWNALLSEESEEVQ